LDYKDILKLENNGKRISLGAVQPAAFQQRSRFGKSHLQMGQKREPLQFLLDRFGHALQLYDILRLDHFIGLVNYWEVPGDAVNAIDGSWEKALPEDFFAKLLSKYPVDRFIAEDLGILNEQVCHFRDSNGFSGMIVLQFCFDESILSQFIRPNVSLCRNQYPKTVANGSTSFLRFHQSLRTQWLLPDDNQSLVWRYSHGR
jgi:4-alpha-glucanotransferase